MGDMIKMAFGGETQAQKEARRAQEKELEQANQEKIDSVQQELGQRTRDLVRRYGVAGSAM